MDIDAQHYILAFIKKNIEINGIKVLHIARYGGEPLLCMDQMQSLSMETNEACKKYKVKTYYQIVVNGYLLTVKNAKILSDLGIKSAQISLDGTKEYHDSKRFLPNDGSTFEKIVSNIGKSCEILKLIMNTNFYKWLNYSPFSD